MAIIKQISPDYVRGNERQRKQFNALYSAPRAFSTADIDILVSFTDRKATAIAVSGSTIVKVDADGADTAISAGDELNGYRVGYKAAGAIAVGDSITGTLEYWDEI